MPRFPLSSLIAIAAIAVTVASGVFGNTPVASIVAFMPTQEPLEQHPWTLLTSVLFHGSVAHLLFNLMAWWYIAARVEAVWGWPKLLASVLALSLISNAAEIALSQEGIGISGVIYGLFALIYVVQRQDPRFNNCVSPRIAQSLAIWFFVCIALTLTGIMNIGNVAHGSGALAGALIGLAINSRGNKRLLWIASIVLLTVASLLGATIARPYINWELRNNHAMAGWTALQRQDYAAACTHLEAAIKADPTDVASLVNLAGVYSKLERFDDALRTYRQAVKLNPSELAECGPYITWLETKEIRSAIDAGDTDRALSLATELVKREESSGAAWRYLGNVYVQRREAVAAGEAFEKARSRSAPTDYPKDAQLYDMASVEAIANRFDDAISHYKQAVELNPSLKESAAPGLALMIGAQAQKALLKDDLDRAQALTREAFTWDPACGNAWWVMGWVHLKRQEFLAATIALDKASFPENDYPKSALLYDRATAQMGAKQYENAAKNFSDCLQLDPARIEAWFYLGECLQELGKTDEALAAYDKATASKEVGDKAKAAAATLRQSGN